jgi:hypothetical protein
MNGPLSQKVLGENKMKFLSYSLLSAILVLFGSVIQGYADEVDNQKIRGYLQMAYDKNVDISIEQLPICSSGVEAIARAQNRAKLGTNEGIADALVIATKYIELSPSTWESDFLRLSLALNHAAIGDFKSAAESAEAALAKNDFGRLQVDSDAALEWLRGNFGKENFSRSCQDHMHRVAAAYYMDHVNPPQYDFARRHIELIGNTKIREIILNQLSSREPDNKDSIRNESNKGQVKHENSVLGNSKEKQVTREWSQSYWYFGIGSLLSLTILIYYYKGKR